jgi:phosphonopyruvate hydrolase
MQALGHFALRAALGLHSGYNPFRPVPHRSQYRARHAAICRVRQMSMQVSRAEVLRAKLDIARPAIAMAAHNPLAAKLATEAGFDAVWGSGFELSASYAVPDASILSMDIHLAMMRAMAEVQIAPLIADLDTGFGNAVNLAYAVPRYAAAGVAAIVIEDKTFPKDSSLRPDGRQELVPVVEFQGKIEAAKAAGQVLVVARTEALIAGLGQDEALRRGVAYAEAGADALLIHSKQKTPDEILSFCHAWRGVPLVLVPTSYPQLSFAEVAALGKVGLIICGNHAIRAAVAAMRRTFGRILAEGGIAGVEQEIASVADIFALQGDANMRVLERAYLR